MRHRCGRFVRFSRPGLVSLAAVAALALAGCGGSTPGTTPGGQPPAATQSGPGPAPTPTTASSGGGYY